MLEILLNNLLLILFAIYFYGKTKNGLHILQLESYKNKRYFKWIINNGDKVIKIKEIIAAVIYVICIYAKWEPLGKMLLSITYALWLITTKYPMQKKAFVVTARIKRMYVTYGIIFIIVAVITNVMPNNGVWQALLLTATILSYFIVIVVNVLNTPIEKSIQKSFYKKAQRKLAEMPSLTVIGITGSYGKTSTKYIVSTILAQKYNVLMTPESYNTTMGVVRTINEKLSATHNLFVCEMGAKQTGDIKEICDLVHPTYGILTAIGPQHLETFKTIENVRKTKLELVDSLPKEGIAFINYEDENIKQSQIEKKHITFGLSKECNYYADEITLSEIGANFIVHTPKGRKIEVKTKLLGKHNITNITGAIAVCDTLGLTQEEIQAGVRFLKPVPHRLELKKYENGNIIIDDAYNSNHKGAQMALEVLKNFQNRTRVLVTPGMVDLGEEAEKYNKEFGRQAAEAADYIILVGEKQAKPIKEGILEKGYQEENLYVAKNLNEAITKMNEIAKENSVILLENDLPDNYL